MKSFHTKLGSMTALASASLAFAASVNAQPAAPAGDTRVKLDEVQVTARREAESIQSVPVSIVALSTEMLRQKNVATTEDIQNVTPGVFMSGSGGRQNVVYSIRGQSKALSGPSSPAVIAYFAEVPEVSWGSAVSEYDLASVQVLKGPQGTLFGRNTLGGAVLYTPAAPTYTLGRDLSVAIGNYNNREFKGALNVPIIDDKLAIRVATDIHRRNGWVKDIGTGDDIENINSQAYRLSVLFDPTENITNTLILDYYQARDNGFASILRDVDPTAAAPAGYGVGAQLVQLLAEQKARGFYTVNYDLPQFTHNERFGATDRLEIKLAPGYELINILGWRNTSLSYNTNVDGIGQLVAFGAPFDFLKADLFNNQHQLTDEVQFRGLSFNDKLDWIAGLFYLKAEPSGSQANRVAFGQFIGAPLSGAAYTFIEETSKAVFLNGKYDLSDFVEGVKFNAGIRYTKDEITACTGSADSGLSNQFNQSDCKNHAVGFSNTSSNTSKSNATTWNIGFDWQVNPDLFSYITARHGYRAGGVNGPTLGGTFANLQTFEPDTVTDLEIGVRSDAHLGDVLLRSNVSVFSGWYDKVQLPVTGLNSVDKSGPGCNAALNPDGDCIVANDPAGGTLLINAGKTRVSGVDFDFTLAPDEHWTLEAAGTLLKLDTRSIDIPSALATRFTSNELPFNNAAKKTFTGSVRYEFPLRNNMGDMAFNLNYYWTGEMPISEQTIPSYGIFNGRIDWTSVAQSNFDLSLFGKNLGNKQYLSGGVAAAPALGITTAMIGAPLTYGVEARYHF
jgi:iron complex outermembrane receptor protein